MPWTLLLAGAALAAPMTMAPHTVPGSDVSVAMPGSVEHRHTERRPIIGRVVSDTLASHFDAGWMAATVTDAPDAALSFAGPATVLNHARGALLRDVEGTQVSWTPVRRGDLEGMRLAFTTTKTTGRPQHGVSEIYTTGTHVLTFTATVQDGEDDAVIEAFFEGIALP